MRALEDGLYSKLYALEIPKQDFRECQVEKEFLSKLTVFMNGITEWIEVGHLTAFELEECIRHGIEVETMAPLEEKVQAMEKTVAECIDLKEEVRMEYKLKLTKIQSEWSGLQHFIRSLKGQLAARQQKRQIQGWMETILVGIDALSLKLFRFQEKRHQQDSYEDLLVAIDHEVGPLFQHVERVYQAMSQNEADEGLDRQHRVVQSRWEWLRVEIDELKLELKEDRWLAVFKQVADQVEGMMDGLDKTVSQYQMRRNTPQSTCSTSSNDSACSGSPQAKSAEKNFEAKFKYYTPSIEKMMTMLGNGISARVSKDATTMQRHQAMVQRWDGLRQTMETMRKRDRPMSPARSMSRLGETCAFKSPEPDFYRSRSPGSHSSVRGSIDSGRGSMEEKQSNELIEERMLPRQGQLRASPMMRRAMTPSLIPRPKTPSEIPRPRTSMARKVSTGIPTQRKLYKADPKDALDIEIAMMVNASPVTIHCQRASAQGKYYLGHGGNRKLYSCKLMTYRNQKNKVLIRVGGGWQDLEIFLPEHMNLVGN